MGEPARKQPTFADILALGEDVHGEIIGSDLVVHASPGIHHGAMSIALGADLVNPFQRGRGGPGGWWFSSEVDVQLPDGQLYRPDIAAWRKERVPDLPHERPFTIRPDWVCEVLSQSNSWYDWGPKREGYAHWGVPHLWLGDPGARTVTVLVLANDVYGVYQVAHDGETVRMPPFEAIEIAIADLLLPIPAEPAK